MSHTSETLAAHEILCSIGVESIAKVNILHNKNTLKGKTGVFHLQASCSVNSIFHSLVPFASKRGTRNDDAGK